VIQTRLGKLPVDMRRVIYFPRGLIGFEDTKEFALLQLKEGSPFLLLQSLTMSELGLLVADPFAFLPDYEVKIGNAEQKILRLENIRQVAVLVTASIPQGRPEQAALNLTGPILLNYASRIGLQIPQVDSKYPARIYINETLRQNAEVPAGPTEGPQGAKGGGEDRKD